MKHVLKDSLLIATLLVLTACNNTSNITSSTNPPQTMSLSQLANSLKSEKACAEHNGKWQKVGKLQMPACILTPKDAGKACTDSSQCETRCIAKDPEPKAGEKADGICADSTNLFGCQTYIKDGRSEGTLCID